MTANPAILLETSLESEVRDKILIAMNGGQATVRPRVWDKIWSTSPWPETYDGRGLRNAVSDDYESGVGIAEVPKRFYQEIRKSQTQELSMKEVSTIRAEIGTGMVKEFQIAGSTKYVPQSETECKYNLLIRVSYRRMMLNQIRELVLWYRSLANSMSCSADPRCNRVLKGNLLQYGVLLF
jgi:hypothetical protein